MLTGVRFSFSPRAFVPILDVIGDLVIENQTQDSTQQLLKAAVIFIKRSEVFKARIFEQTNTPVGSEYKHVYFSLIFPSNLEMRNFVENFYK